MYFASEAMLSVGYMVRYRTQVEIATPLSKYLKSAMCRNSVEVARLCLAWPTIVGQELSPRCAPLQIKHHRLLVATTSHPWAQELSMQRLRLYDRILKVIDRPSFEELRFCVDAAFVSRIVGARDSKS